jgi:hypothetical protein
VPAAAIVARVVVEVRPVAEDVGLDVYRTEEAGDAAGPAPVEEDFVSASSRSTTAAPR